MSYIFFCSYLFFFALEFLHNSAYARNAKLIAIAVSVGY